MAQKQYPLRIEENELEKIREEAKALDISLNAMIKIKLLRKENAQKQ